MSKRCSARTCFNGQAHNNRVTYFGFPKSIHYAHRWAEEAGREDLMTKPILTLVKYCLCSEHFTDDCFVDPDTKTKLKKSRHPFSVPIPTIFKNNFMDNLKSKQICFDIRPEESSQDYSENSNSVVLPKSNDENSNTALITEIYEPINTFHEVKNGEEYDVTLVMDEDGMIENEEIAIVEVNQSNDDEGIVDLTKNICRFCNNLYDTFETCPIFSSDQICNFIYRVMDNKITKNDGHPQNVCYQCSHKIKYCVNVISFFDSVQRELK